MIPSFDGRFLAWGSAVVATMGLLAFGWSPTAVLLLYWVETAAVVLVPLLPPLVFVFARREGFAAGTVLLLLLLVLVPCMFLAGHAFVISVLGLFEMGAITDLHGTTLTVPLYAPLVATFRDPWFLASAAAIVALSVFEFYPRLALRGDSRPAPNAAVWTRTMFTRLLVGQFAVVVGGAAIIVTQLPSAAALVLVAVKLWLDLRSTRAKEPAAPVAQ